MKILVTGAKGFIGKNLIAELKNRGYGEIYAFDIDTEKTLLRSYTSDCDFVFHLAGIGHSAVYRADQGRQAPDGDGAFDDKIYHEPGGGGRISHLCL